MVVQEQSSFARGDQGAGIRLSGEFHLKLAEMARNAPLVSFQRSLVSQTSLIIAQYESGGRSRCSFDEHNEILDAIEKGDKRRAVTLMMHHMEHIDSKLNLESDNASGDLHAVFSHLLGGEEEATPGQGRQRFGGLIRSIEKPRDAGAFSFRQESVAAMHRATGGEGFPSPCGRRRKMVSANSRSARLPAWLRR